MWQLGPYYVDQAHRNDMLSLVRMQKHINMASKPRNLLICLKKIRNCCNIYTVMRVKTEKNLQLGNVKEQEAYEALLGLSEQALCT